MESSCSPACVLPRLISMCPSDFSLFIQNAETRLFCVRTSSFLISRSFSLISLTLSPSFPHSLSLIVRFFRSLSLSLSLSLLPLLPPAPRTHPSPDLCISLAPGPLPSSRLWAPAPASFCGGPEVSQTEGAGAGQVNSEVRAVASRSSRRPAERWRRQNVGKLVGRAEEGGLATGGKGPSLAAF